jgi:hypothetical protein
MQEVAFGIRYEFPGGLAFKLERGAETSDAWYKLDDQPARPWGDLRAKLVAAGSLADAERLDNQSGGWVVLPLTKFERAKVGAVRIGDTIKNQMFRPDGVEETLGSAAGKSANL